MAHHQKRFLSFIDNISTQPKIVCFCV